MPPFVVNEENEVFLWDDKVAPKGKRVHFAEEERINYVRCCSEISVEEKSLLWFSGTEFREIGVANYRDAQRAIGEKCEEEHDSSVRGIESLLNETFRRERRCCRKRLVAAVLEEQHQQQSECIDNAISIAAISIKASHWSKELAIGYGVADALESKKIQEETPPQMGYPEPTQSCVFELLELEPMPNTGNDFAQGDWLGCELNDREQSQPVPSRSGDSYSTTDDWGTGWLM
mmetsp:Transcript_25673/g.52569  ORF Transcript_25673/g.52569 Transcript_25673/m.52569 type:complete len:232 (-) Transcript_25673:43-738(-)|eukprot:CAMPEP_0183309218 /NCGR_PEP_ID=MMETSP0160_2-20130417/24538_1 /TAXON_ID=2839 ORGANISM="Odontella Sinensis, Strain Grunow 1884" /NCGR_SAMPLE_ID=MMETSP0160_2 /ASSEMBLY_ACC=CAM_ASM_000250 /LENGTH=231 /DNA_ID=CAMNT_0025473213 /DNA_START=130 /DNA_END=825 /DNA_ORIENTATION=+